MKDGFIKVAAATPKIRVADTAYNSENIIKLCKEANSMKINALVFPELSITGYTCGDLFLQNDLIISAKESLIHITNATKEFDMIIMVGLPLLADDTLYNVCAVIKSGEILGFVPKTNIPNYSEFYELRHFSVPTEKHIIRIMDKDVLMWHKQIFRAKGIDEFRFACEICEDLWVTAPPSSDHALNGALLIFNLSASDEIVSKPSFRRMLVRSQSARCNCAYVYCDAGKGESTTDMVFSGHNIIAEHGSILCESELFSDGITAVTDVDLNKATLQRQQINTFYSRKDSDYETVWFDTEIRETKLVRKINAHPFVPKNDNELLSRCEEIFRIQYMGLCKRLEHIGTKTVTIGISGGLDSTLALLVAVKAFDNLKLDRKGIISVTMPCFGTTDRTYNNAVVLAKGLGTTLKEIPIAESVKLHLNDIGASLAEHDVTYENAQARERTQVLMDIANKTGGIVIGTGDLSELALGFATYNGDHMSMYGVNASIPKTLVRYLVAYSAKNSDELIRKTLEDILATPVSPELLPPDEVGKIKQKTEDIVGPYELHDFFLYNMIRHGFSKSKILRLAKLAFSDVYDDETISKWLEIFYRRFFNNQFKRSALPDGPKVGTVTLSPRGDFRMPSDAVNFFSGSTISH